ncbi:MAG: transporter substrate-binding domain-containing protein [Deltaproteobacteria bacterium]|nr:transporter substrate-binding domain-containing protein [Deltaproteobacteria bacterium]MBT6498622.1 transporter substrate-binding domain-containing protein [Deltaproteobacteria bacterium]MBT7710934.1 transporter substrate-binding domain-containing protein [Deltaproteobacteria bacterium]
MKKTLLILWLAFFFSSITVADTVILVADKWCPYNCTPGAEQPGFLVEIARKAFERAGHKLEYRLMPWKRAVAEAKKGNVNGIIGFTKKNVKGFITTQKELIIAREVFFAKAGSPWKYSSVRSLEEIERVGFPNGYHFTSDIDAYIKKSKNVYLIPGAEPLKSMVKMLLHNRIQAFPENAIVVEYYLKQNGLTGKLTVAGEYSRSPIFIGFGLQSATHKQDAAIISEGMQALQDSGEYDRIMKRYGLQR